MLRAILLASALCGAVAPAYAESSAKDVQVALRSLRFLTAKPTPPVQVAVVHAPDNAESRRDAAVLMEAMSSGKVSGTPVVARLVDVSSLDSLSGAAVAFVTAGLDAQQNAIFGAAKALGILSISTQSACAEAGHCVMAVQAEPKVRIVVNAMAAKASGIDFEPTFRMMISEI